MRAIPRPTRAAAGQSHHRAEVRSDSGAFAPIDVSYTVPEQWEPVTEDGIAPLIPGLVPLAACLGEDVHIEGAVPAEVPGAAESVAAMFTSWWGWRRPVVSAAEVRSTRSTGTGIGMFFSRGVDSWSVLLDRLAGPVEQRPTHLLTLDAEPVLPPKTVETLLAGTDEIGHALDLPVIRVATNIRDLLDPFAAWPRHTHGSVLAGAALLLRPLFGTVVLSATQWAPVARDWGSHPELETKWSLPGFDLTHVDAGQRRWRRVENIAHSQLALDTLQVCFHTDEPTNCGRCEKCLRTMTSLTAAGALDNATTFAEPLRTAPIREIPGITYNIVSDVLEHLDTCGTELDELRQAWEGIPVDVTGHPEGTDTERPMRRRLAVPGDARVARQHLNPALHEVTGLRVDHFDTTVDEPVQVGWEPGQLGLLPLREHVPEVVDALGNVGERAEPWVIAGAATAEQLTLAEEADAALGAGLLVCEHDPVEQVHLARRARCRLWWGVPPSGAAADAAGALDPTEVLHALHAGCVPIQVLPDSAAHRLRLRLPHPWDQLVQERSRLDVLTPKHVKHIAAELAVWLSERGQQDLVRAWWYEHGSGARP